MIKPEILNVDDIELPRHICITFAHNNNHKYLNVIKEIINLHDVDSVTVISDTMEQIIQEKKIFNVSNINYPSSVSNSLSANSLEGELSNNAKFDIMLNDAIDKNEYSRRHGIKYSQIIIIDMMFYNGSVSNLAGDINNNDNFKRIIMNGRHYNISMILLNNVSYNLRPELRDNMDYVFLDLNDKFKIIQYKRFYDQWFCIFSTFTDFLDYVNSLVDNKTSNQSRYLVSINFGIDNENPKLVIVDNDIDVGNNIGIDDNNKHYYDDKTNDNIDTLRVTSSTDNDIDNISNKTISDNNDDNSMFANITKKIVISDINNGNNMIKEFIQCMNDYNQKLVNIILKYNLK